MTLTELTRIISKKTGVPLKSATSVLKEFLEASTSALKSGERVKLTGYGVFYVREFKPRSYFGKKKTGIRHTVRFQPSRRSPWKNIA